MKSNKLHNASFIGIIIIFLCFLFISCNPTKRAYKQIAKLPPISIKDSLRLSQRSLATFPVKPPVLKPGKPTVIVKQDSALKYRKLADSLAKLAPKTIKEIQVKYQDTCTTAVDTYTEGYNVGYRIGLYDGKSSCPPSTEITKTDTLQISDPAQAVLIGKLQIEGREAADTIEQLNSKLKAKNKLIAWLFGISGILALLLFLLFKSKRK